MSLPATSHAAALAVALLVSPPALAGVFYDGPVAVVESDLEVDLGQSAEVTESAVLRNNGAADLSVEITFELPPRSAVLAGTAPTKATRMATWSGTFVIRMPMTTACAPTRSGSAGPIRSPTTPTATASPTVSRSSSARTH